MMGPTENKNTQSENNRMPLAETGNASNPSPQPEETEAANASQLLGEGAEKYLREGGNIEDMPDAKDEQEAEKLMAPENE